MIQKIDEQRKDRTRKEYIYFLISSALEHKEDMERTQKNTDDSRLIVALEGEVTYLRSKLDELTRLLYQAQTLHLQHLQQTRGLLSAPDQRISKKWWEFWKT